MIIKILLIIFAIIGLFKFISLLISISILSVKNNIKRYIGNKLEKHYFEINRSISCGICDWLYLIPTVRTSISCKFFEIEIDMFVFYIFIDYKIVDIDEDKK